MLIHHEGCKLASTWYTKATDTGLMINFLALPPMRYKRSAISGMIHCIYRACSTWKAFHDSLEKAEVILLKNQYPEEFFEPLIKKVLNSIIVNPIRRRMNQIGKSSFFNIAEKCQKNSKHHFYD